MLRNPINLKRNILANFIGQGWSTVLGLVVVPFYIRYLGMEGYGLVGFYTTMQAVFNSFLDFGLSATINREIARYLAVPEKIGQTRDLVRTLEVGYWSIGILLGAGVSLGAPVIAKYWIQSENISIPEIQYVVVIMGILTAIQWPLTFYQGGLIGLEKIQLLNGIQVIMTTIRSAGGVLILWLYSASVQVFFEWQIVVSLIQLGFTTFFLWYSLPASDHLPRIRPVLFKEIWRFIAGMSGISFISFFLGQADRIILSKFLKLEYFGYYNLATTLSTGLQMIGSQIVNALFPRFSSLLAKGNHSALRTLYHKSSQFMAVVILPIATVSVLFLTDLIQLWTGDAVVAVNTASIAALLLIGSSLNIIVSIPYRLTIAYGWTSLGFFQNLVSIIIIGPLMILLSLRFGGVGAALTWLFLNSGYFLILPVFVHRRVLQGELSRWYLVDIFQPLVFTVLVAGVGSMLVSSLLPEIFLIPGILFVGLSSLIAAALTAPHVRSWIVTQSAGMLK